MFIKILRLLLTLPLVLILITITVINSRIHYQPEVIVDKGDTVQYELLKELRGLKHALHQQADVEMQTIYPEGYVFLNAVYSLAWASFLFREEHTGYRDEGHREIQNAWERINSPTGRSTFDENLALPYGSYYNGWSSYVLACKLRLEADSMRSEREVHHFKQQCDKIAEAIQLTTYPESYEGAAWPADAMVCVASLSLHDKLFAPKYTEAIREWLIKVKKRVDPRGMIPHSVYPENGSVAQNARGSSMALMLIFLRDIDVTFAEEQFRLFKENFVDDKFGLTGIREYAKGESADGDIDSGPVVFGFGGAATIVGMQTLSQFGEDELSLRIRNAVEALSFPIQQEDHKQHLFGSLPIADAFIAWSHSGIKPQPEPTILFLGFHILSLFIVVLLSIAFWAVIPKLVSNRSWP